MFDSDPLTFFHTNDTLSWGGLELEQPTVISKIRYIIRNDNNGIRKGDEYELFYMDKGNWKSLGKQTATEDDGLLYKQIPKGALYWLRDYTKGKAERIHVQDHNTFDKILSNIKLVQNTGVQVVVRVNTDNQNVKDFLKLNTLFKEQGFTDSKNFKIYSALLRNNTNISSNEKKSLDFISTNSFFNKHKEMGTISMCADYGTFQKIYNAISKGKPISFCSTFCASQSGAYVLDPLGNIYPCWETIGEKEFQIGDYSTEQINWNEEKKQKWQRQDISSSDKCKHCKYALFCGGGCIAHTTSNGKNTHCSYFYTIFKNIANRAYERYANI